MIHGSIITLGLLMWKPFFSDTTWVQTDAGEARGGEACDMCTPPLSNGDDRQVTGGVLYGYGVQANSRSVINILLSYL